MGLETKRLRDWEIGRHQRLFSPSFLWKEVPRRGGGWPRETVLPHSGKPTPPRFARLPLPKEGARMIFKETLIKSLSFAVWVLRFPHMCRTLLRFPHLSFMPPVPYPPLRGTFPSFPFEPSEPIEPAFPSSLSTTIIFLIDTSDCLFYTYLQGNNSKGEWPEGMKERENHHGKCLCRDHQIGGEGHGWGRDHAGGSEESHPHEG